jgi:hypothetical protein
VGVPWILTRASSPGAVGTTLNALFRLLNGTNKLERSSVPVRPLPPSLIFAGKARSLP